MQALQTPFSFDHSRKLNNGQSAYPRHKLRQMSCFAPPMIDCPGAAASRLDDLLICASRASASTQGSIHPPCILVNSHTFVQENIYSTSSPTLYVEEEKVIQYTQPSLQHDLFHSFPDRPVLNFYIPQSLFRNRVDGATRHLTISEARVQACSLDAVCDKMNIIASVPGSPPDLSESRSSKTSSYNSRSSDPDVTLAEIINFEEIGLDDSRKPASNFLQMQARNNHPGDSKNTRPHAPYYTTRKPPCPELHEIRTRSNDGGQVYKHALKRGFTSPALGRLPGQASTSRSASPPRRLVRASSAVSIDHSTSGDSLSQPPFAPSSRRGSWQPRKTVKEIEAEFHDSDDELPEDASLWNVPISPFPSDNKSARSSAKGSPERVPVQNPLPLPLEHIRSAPESPPHKRLTTQVLPRQRLTPRSASTNHAKSNPSSPRMPANARNGRTKSWNIAMTELSAEARILSQNLEYHADQQASNTGARTWDEKWLPPIPQRSSAPGAIQLPPIQRGTLDFMPISKEKEAILSRTRPSWLPPKDPKEEKKHIREYQRMMAASLEAEKKKENKTKVSACVNDETQVRLNRIWDYYVDPTTDLSIIDRRVYDLCWRGISPRLRGKVWCRTVGNPLGLTSKTYGKALDRVADIKAKDSRDLSRHEQGLMASFSDIDRDVETAFPDLKLFQRDSPLWQDLRNICEAHASYRSDIGYLYGIQLIGGLILLQVPDPVEAFILLENCLNNPVPLAFQTGDVALIQRTYNRVISTLEIKFPRLRDYLFGDPENGGLGFTGEEILEPMFRTLFSNGLDIDCLCRVLDIWVFEGDRTFIKTAVAVLGALEQQIFSIEGDLHLKRRNVQEMLGWGPFNRSQRGSYWQIQGTEDLFIENLMAAGKLDYTGR